GRHRQVVERDADGLRHVGEVGMVRHHRRDLGRQRAGTAAIDQIVETVALLRDQDQQPLPDSEVMHLPVHAELSADRGEGRTDPVGGHVRVAHLEVDAHEEPAAQTVAELLAVQDVAAVLGEQTRDGVDDAEPVRAGQGEDVLPALRLPALRPRRPGTVGHGLYCPGHAPPAEWWYAMMRTTTLLV